MSNLGWPFRRELLVADALLVIGVARTFELENGGLRWLTIVVLGYLVVCMHLFAVVADGRRLESRLTATFVIKQLANICLFSGAAFMIPLLAATPSFSGGMFYEPPPQVLGFRAGDIVLVGAAAMLVVGWAWIHRLARAGGEPESNDEFWWSRA